MKTLLNGMKCAVFAAWAMGLALGAQAGSGAVEYLEPVYVGGVVTNGIDHWETKTLDFDPQVSNYHFVTNSTSTQTWGESGKTNWYVATEANVEIANGIVCKGFVNLILCKGAKLTVKGAYGYAGIQTDDNGAFVIYGTPQGEGELSATGGYNGAGIGGSDDIDTGVGSHITINGGKVTAQSTGYKAAGIGSAMNERPGYDITINGGTVIAKAPQLGAGIGGSVQGEGHDITINGGRVLACSGKSAAIGGGCAMAEPYDYSAENTAGYNITINGGSVCVSGCGDVIGSRTLSHPAYNNRIAAGANVLFCLDAGLEEPLELTGSMVLVGSAESLADLSYKLSGGLVGFGIETLTMTNATTHETQTVVVDDEALVPFSGLKAAVRVSDGFARLFVGHPIEANPTEVLHAQITGVYTNGVLSSASSPWTVWTYEPAFAVYEAESGYVFQDGSTVMTNRLDTTVSPAVSTRPLPSALQGPPVAELRDAEGVWQGVFDSLGTAIDAAQDGETVALLTNLQESVTFKNACAVTLDLAGWTLMPASGSRVITVNDVATAKIRDTSAAKTGSITTGGATYNDNGAGVYVDNGALYMFGVTITNCVASGSGGAICGNYNARILLKDCTVTGNSATGNGGGICMLGGETDKTTTEGGSTDGKLVLLATVITGNAANGNGGGVYFKKTVVKSCFVAGTKIRLADGSEKAIEDILEGDVVATFDHEGGTNSTARVYYACKGEGKATPFTLEFEEDAARSVIAPYQMVGADHRAARSLSIVGCHDLLLKDTRKYVTLTAANVGQYIGAKFYGADGAWHTLTNVTMGTEAVDYYSLYSAQHQNVYANGLLTVCDDVDYLLNIYELDENLKADADQLAADLAQYGEMSYEEAATYGVSREWYDAGSVKYLNVAIGKQLVSKAYAEQLFASVQSPVSRVSAPLSAVERPLSSLLSAPLMAVAPKMMTTAPVMATAAEPEPSLADFNVNVMTVGGSTVVTNNTVSGKSNNVYLDYDKENKRSEISLAGDRAGMCVGVTLYWGSGQFTDTSANPGDVAYFWDDAGTYAVWHHSDNYLYLADGSQIVPPAVAHTTFEVFVGGVSKGSATSVAKSTSATVVYTADPGYVFAGGATTKEVSVDTSNTVATMTPPDEPFVPVASVTTGGVTTDYATLMSAWAAACEVLETGADATVKMLKDATVESALTTGAKSKGALTLDLNDHVLAYAGQNDSLVMQESGTLHVVDTATPSAVHYFTCDKTTGLWTLTNEVTDLSVKGGLLTGARNSAIYFRQDTGAHSISNVNFVGNSSTYNGGAVSTYTASIGIAITDCTFLGNVAPNNGGAVSSGNFTMTDCRVEENVASLDGGGLYVRDHGSLVRTKVVGNKAAKGGGICVTYSPGGCFPAGVRILMADGSEKNVEEVVEGDVVATFDHEGGVKSSAAVFYVYRGTGGQSVFTLSFASGAKLDVADRHDLLLEATRKYVTVSYDNARSHVGSRFYNYATGEWDTLTGVTAAKDCDVHYSLYTRGHANCVANGMLTVSDDKDFYLNVYELDENLKADAEQLATDIGTYGLATPDDYPNIPLDDFADSNMRYARIAIGKGLTTQKEILYWNEFDYGPVVAKKAKGVLKLTASAVEAVAPSAAYLQVGEGVVVTGNVSAVGADNAHLDKSNNAVIDILSGTGLDVGITLSSGIGVFGWTNDVNYASGFFSDNPAYQVAYDVRNGCLKLVAPILAIPTPIEHTTYVVYTNGFLSTENEPGRWAAWKDEDAYVVYTADDEYFFDGEVSVVTNALDTTASPAVNKTLPVGPFKKISDIPCGKTDETTVKPAENPDPEKTPEETWTKATNMVASVVTVEATAVVADSVLTNAVMDAKDTFEKGDTNVVKVITDIEIVVTPTGAESDPTGAVRAVTMDVTPFLTTWAEVTDGAEVSTNQFGERTSEFAYSGKPMLISFSVSNLADAPMLVIHRHGEEVSNYVCGDEPTETTFAYNAETKAISLLMSKFSELETRSDIPVGDAAYAKIDPSSGVCTITGTGDMWSYAKAGTSALWGYRDSITRVVVGDGVTGVGANAFAYMKCVKDVEIGGAVTNVCEDAFFSCLNVTNLVVGASVQTVGNSAFGRCNSLADLAFGSSAVAEACQGKAFKIVARITMNGETPVVDAVPKVTIKGYARTLQGCEKLGDEWETIQDEDNIPAKYHFFRYAYEPVK